MHLHVPTCTVLARQPEASASLLNDPPAARRPSAHLTNRGLKPRMCGLKPITFRVQCRQLNKIDFQYFRTFSHPSSRRYALCRRAESASAAMAGLGQARQRNCTSERLVIVLGGDICIPRPSTLKSGASKSRPTTKNHQSSNQYPKVNKRHHIQLHHHFEKINSNQTKSPATMPSADWEQHFLDKFIASSSRSSSPAASTPRNSSPARWNSTPRQSIDAQTPRSTSTLSPTSSHGLPIVTSTAPAAAPH
jgi:hypothetical protein